jgi:hypothetical protein
VSGVTPEVAVDEVLGLAAGLLSLDRRRVRRLRGQRLAALGSVVDVVQGLGCELRGSWRWGDFHLDEHGSWSCSDIDVVHTASGLPGTVESLAGPLRLAAHAVDYEAVLSGRMSAAFALVNLASARLAEGNRRYVEAKCQLMLARRSIDERYADVAVRVGGAGLLARKLGIGHPPPVDGWLPAEPVPDPLVALLGELEAGMPSAAQLQRLGQFIEQDLTELDPRHRAYVAGKVARLVSAT